MTSEAALSWNAFAKECRPAREDTSQISSAIQISSVPTEVLPSGRWQYLSRRFLAWIVRDAFLQVYMRAL